MHEGPEGFVLLELEDGVVLRGVGESLAGESVGFAVEGLLEVELGDLAASLPMHHNDPFDRMLVAQAMVDGMVLVTADETLGKYPVKRCCRGKNDDPRKIPSEIEA